MPVSLLAEVVLKEGLKGGAGTVRKPAGGAGQARPLPALPNAAVRFLGYRPRSEAEIRQRLQRRGFDSDCTEKALARLKEQGLVDDTAFARFWKDNRQNRSARAAGG